MTKGLIGGVLIACWLCTTAYAEQIDVSQLADAIYLAEGGRNTRFPYGIKSVRCEGERECRKVCLNTIRNNIKRWKASGDTRPFISFLGARYAPLNDKADKTGLNKNWVNNVTKLYRRAKHG